MRSQSGATRVSASVEAMSPRVAPGGEERPRGEVHPELARDADALAAPLQRAQAQPRMRGRGLGGHAPRWRPCTRRGRAAPRRPRDRCRSAPPARPGRRRSSPPRRAPGTTTQASSGTKPTSAVMPPASRRDPRGALVVVLVAFVREDADERARRAGTGAMNASPCPARAATSSWPSPHAAYFRVRSPIVDQKPGTDVPARRAVAGEPASGDLAVRERIAPVLDVQRATRDACTGEGDVAGGPDARRRRRHRRVHRDVAPLGTKGEPRRPSELVARLDAGAQQHDVGRQPRAARPARRGRRRSRRPAPRATSCTPSARSHAAIRSPTSPPSRRACGASSSATSVTPRRAAPARRPPRSR